MKTSNAMVTIDQIGVCGNHMNMLTIESDAMMMAATRPCCTPEQAESDCGEQYPDNDVDPSPCAGVELVGVISGDNDEIVIKERGDALKNCENRRNA